MITFGLTGSKAQCAAAKKQLGRLFSELGLLTWSKLGDTWAHSRFKSPYLRHTLWELGYAVDTLETAINWRNYPPRLSGLNARYATLYPIYRSTCLRT